MKTEKYFLKEYQPVIWRGMLVTVFIIMTVVHGQAWATFNNVQGFAWEPGKLTCGNDPHSTLVGKSTLPIQKCNLKVGPGLYVPHDGIYYIKSQVGQQWGQSGSYYLSASIPLADQTVNAQGNRADLSTAAPASLCFLLWDEDFDKFSALEGTTVSDSEAHWCPGYKPLPPYPAGSTTCSINSGNALNVNLGTVERSSLPTVPGSGSLRHIQIPVDCAGAGNVAVNMQLNYTPITLSSTMAVKASSNGLGVAIIYENKTLSTTDITPLTFLPGSNTLDLAFQAVRDPSVAVGEVPTGTFSASAVLVMTQQ